MTQAFISPGATIGRDCTIGAGAVITADVIIGDRCIIGPGAVIGSPGFGFKWEGGRWREKQHPFPVLIGDDVQIGANTVINCGSWRPTLIKTGARIDALVFAAHNVEIHEYAVVVAGAELSGSVIVRGRAWVGPKACVREHRTIGEYALVGMGAVVTKNVEARTTVVGNPARVLPGRNGTADVDWMN